MDELKKVYVSNLPSINVGSMNAIPKLGQNLERKLLTILALGFIIYFMWMDISLYNHVLNRKPGQQFEKVSLDARYDPFTHYTVKSLMLFPLDGYCLIPAGHAFESLFHLADTWVTPNIISIFSFFVGCFSARLLLHESIWIRRISVVLGIFRLWLDDLDGIIYRMKKHSVTQISEPGSLGSTIDMLCDTLSMGAYTIGVWGYLAWWNRPKDYHSLVLPLWRKNHPSNAGYELVSNGSTSSGNTSQIYVSRRIIFLRLFWFCAVLATATGFWDRYHHQYTSILEQTDPSLRNNQEVLKLQNEMYTSTSMWIVLWFWRMCNGMAIIIYVFIAVIVDKVWEFFVVFHCLGTVFVPFLIVATEIHLAYARAYVGVEGDLFNTAELGWIITIPIIVIPVCCLCNRFSRFFECERD